MRDAARNPAMTADGHKRLMVTSRSVDLRRNVVVGLQGTLGSILKYQIRTVGPLMRLEGMSQHICSCDFKVDSL